MEFEGKHQFLQDQLRFEGVIYWSEGYEELVTEPFHFKEKVYRKQTFSFAIWHY